MAEKVTSMRLNDEDLEQFKAFAKDNRLNQAEAFNSLIALAELEKAKEVLGDRGKEIESFRDTVNKLLNFYINSLEVNTTTEQTIREELSKELNIKENTITNLYEQLQELKANTSDLDNSFKEIDSKYKELQEQLHKATTEIIDKNTNIDKANSYNNTLKEQLEEYKQYKTNYKDLEKDLEQLKKELSTKDNTINNLENSNKQLDDKLNNNIEMITFYKKEIDNKDKSIIEYKADIKALDSKYNKQIEEVKIEAIRVLDERIKSNAKEYLNRLDAELSKKDLEIERLNNAIAQFKPVKNIKK